MRREIMRPGWHPDPTGRHRYREWNGSTWTEHVSDEGRASIDPFEPRAARRPRRSKRRQWIIRRRPVGATPVKATRGDRDAERLFWGDSS